ncbi:MAG: PaaI family thioesterase [Hellea sp.]|nr:PaaI family thioesterase [Hellea sp.]
MSDSVMEKMWAMAPAFVEGVPHGKALGIKFVSVDRGKATMALPYSAKIIGDPATRVIHGGAITTVLDQVSGLAAVAAIVTEENILAMTGVATLDLSIDYMRPAKPGETVIATAHCYKTTHHIAFVRAIAHDGDDNDPVATSQATFMISHAGGKP